MPRTTRRATHAGSWYEDNGAQHTVRLNVVQVRAMHLTWTLRPAEQTLHGEIAEWMRQASAVDGQHARAVIGPYALCLAAIEGFT